MTDVHFPGAKPTDKLVFPTINVPEKKIAIQRKRIDNLRKLEAKDAASARVEGKTYKVSQEGIQKALSDVNFGKIFSDRKAQGINGKMEIVFTIGKDGNIDKISYYSHHGRDVLNTGSKTFQELAHRVSLPLSKLKFDNVKKHPITVRQPLNFKKGTEVTQEGEVKVSKHRYVHYKKVKG